MPVKAANPWNYRGRASFHVDKGAWGFFGGKSHSVIDIDECPIVDPVVNRAFKGIKGALSGKKHGIYAVEVVGSPIDNRAVASFYVYEEKKIDWHGCLSGVEAQGLRSPALHRKKGGERKYLREGSDRPVLTRPWSNAQSGHRPFFAGEPDSKRTACPEGDRVRRTFRQRDGCRPLCRRRQLHPAAIQVRKGGYRGGVERWGG